MIKDRGNIKWSSLMLVEHREELKKLLAQADECPKPELDQQKLEQMNQVLKQAIHDKKPVSIIYYYKKRYHHFQGLIKKYNSIEKEFTLINKDLAQKIKLDNIIEITI